MKKGTVKLSYHVAVHNLDWLISMEEDKFEVMNPLLADA